MLARKMHPCLQPKSHPTHHSYPGTAQPHRALPTKGISTGRIIHGCISSLQLVLTASLTALHREHPLQKVNPDVNFHLYYESLILRTAQLRMGEKIFWLVRRQLLFSSRTQLQNLQAWCCHSSPSAQEKPGRACRCSAASLWGMEGDTAVPMSPALSRHRQWQQRQHRSDRAQSFLPKFQQKGTLEKLLSQVHTLQQGRKKGKVIELTAAIPHVAFLKARSLCARKCIR